MSFHSLNSSKFEAQLGYIISPLYWGNGFGSEVLISAINYAFSELGLKVFFAEVDPNNISSESILEKCGFELVDCKKSDLVIEGVYYDTNIYKLTKGYV